MSYQPQEIAGVQVYQLDSPRKVYQLAYILLHDLVDEKTLLLLSGGDNLTKLYKLLSEFGTIIPGAAAMTDEIFGPPFHYKSHEAQLRESNLIEHFAKKGVPFFRILSRSASPSGTARLYENQIHHLYKNLTSKIGLLELHPDGSIASLLPYRDEWSNPALTDENLVAGFKDPSLPEEISQRVTLTFRALREVDNFIVLAIGEEKKATLRKLLRSDKHQITHIPSTFLRNQPHAKVHLLTDQKLGSNTTIL